MDWPSGSHASTFGGNPVSCRAALATLDLLDREYIANAEARGEQLHRGLEALAKRCPVLRQPRGLGLMRAIDVVDPQSGEGEHARRDDLVQAAFHQGLLLLGCGEYAVRFCPPLCISAEQIDTALHILDRLLATSPAEKEAVASDEPPAGNSSPLTTQSSAITTH